MTKFETSVKGGTFRNLIRACFEVLDADEDDRLSVVEIIAAMNPDGSDALSSMSAKFHELFPLRPTAGELKEFLRIGLQSIAGGGGLSEASVSAGMSGIDEDGDGYIQRKEAGKAYNAAGKKFLELAKTVKSMGPMMAMFGGGGGMGGMNMGNEF